MYQNILVPVDISHEDVARRILRLAKLLAGDGGRITVLHVMTQIPAYAEAYVPPEMRDQRVAEIRAALDGLVASAGLDKARVDVSLHAGMPSPHILDSAREMKADLIVIGSHRPELSDYLLGSTAARVVRHARCSVLVDR